MDEHRDEKICPQCRVSYQAWASECSDCGVALEAWSPAPERAPAQLPPAEELEVLWRSTPSQLRGLAELLAAAGLSCRIDAYPPSGGATPSSGARQGGGDAIALYVMPADAPRAEALREAFLRDGLPDASEPAGAQQAEGCPACGHPLAPDAADCPDCGLAFPE